MPIDLSFEVKFEKKSLKIWDNVFAYEQIKKKLNKNSHWK